MNQENCAVVLETLRKATSQNAEQLKPAEQQLKCWETEKWFYSALLSIFSDHTVEVNVRWLAVLYIKNGIERYWRKTATNAICEDEKKVLRQKMISNFYEPVNQLALQLAVLVSKVARFDCPAEWPELVPTLLQVVRNPEDLPQQRSLLVLHHVTKSLASKRLAGDRRVFQELASNIFGFILQLWTNQTEAFLSQMANNQNNVGITLEKSYLCLKVLRKLVVHGFKEPARVPEATMFLSLVFQWMKPMLQCRKTLKCVNPNLRQISEKYVVLFTKVLHDVLELHPFSYIPFIKPSLETAISLCFTEAGEGLLFERFIVQSLNLIKAIVSCAEYSPSKLPDDVQDPATLEAAQVKMTFFTYSTVTEMCRRLVLHYFLLTEEELATWDTDPEGFASDGGGEAWKFCLRQCSEVLFLTVFHEFRETLAPLLLEMVQGIQPADGTISFQAMLNRDAVYTAVGLAAFDLHDELDFDNWFLHVLIPELKVSEPRYRIVRRRVAWLIGQWFNTEQFLPYLESYVSLLYKLLQQVTECDTKISILHMTSFIIERVGSQIMPYAGDLVQYLPLLWETCGEHHMLRCAIVTTLVQVVNGLGAQSERLHPFLLPVVAFGVDVHQSPHVYLLEDCLDLWWALLANTHSTSVELLQLAQYLFPLFELGSENMKMCLQVVQAYILLFPKEFLQTYGDRLLKATTDLVNDLNREGMLFVMRMVELVIRVFPEQGPQLFYPLLIHALDECLEGEKASMLTSVCLSIISRVILHCKSCFTKLLQEEAQGKGCDAEEVFGNLLDKWIEKMPLVNPIEREKLLALTLTSILTSNSNAVYERICGILLSIVEVLNDVTKCDNLGAQVDSLVMLDSEPIPPSEEESEHDRRKIELSRQDPVHTVALRDYLCSQMRSLRESLGEQNFEELMGQVDVETMQQLKSYLEGGAQPNGGSTAGTAATGNQASTAPHTANAHPT
ncbi:hypothetical protein V5799_016510 [Amblyomma americanum]|uniref:Importin N-terminal domain-containing protein n=1 Tax=Amblyomma americanum TaxID=6943 RepID=A0AAQ4F4T8_AMBAM